MSLVRSAIGYPDAKICLGRIPKTQAVSFSPTDFMRMFLMFGMRKCGVGGQLPPAEAGGLK